MSENLPKGSIRGRPRQRCKAWRVRIESWKKISQVVSHTARLISRLVCAARPSELRAVLISTRLLASSPRYREAVAAGSNPQAYVQSIAKAGYATDPEYGNKLNKMLNSGTLRAALGARLAKL